MAILLSKFQDLLNADFNQSTDNTSVSSLLNKQIDGLKIAQTLFQDIEGKRSSATALSRNDANTLKGNTQLTSIRHESRINTLYRLIGIPSEINLEGGQSINFIDNFGQPITSTAALSKTLLSREFEQLSIYLNNLRVQASSTSDYNKALDQAQAQGLQLIGDLFDPTKIKTTRLFPAIQFSAIAAVVETANRIAPVFASTNEKYLNGKLLPSPFLESVITIRLLPQSGGTAINTTGAVEDVIIASLAYTLVDIARKFNINQSNAEKMIVDGIATIRSAPPTGISNTALAKSGDANAGERETNSPKVELDIQQQNLQDQITLYGDITALLPLENDVIPTAGNLSGTPITSTNIKDNALTGSFLGLINFNLDAVNRINQQNSATLKKRQLVQDKLTAEIGSIIQNVGGISIAEIIIVLSALFILDEQDLMGLIPLTRFNQITAQTNTTQTSTNANSTPQRQINIFSVLQQYKESRHNTNLALKNFQDLIQQIYNSFTDLLKKSHSINS